MDNTIISWNVPNWITVVLMAALGFAVFGAASKAVVKMRAGSDA